MGWCATGCKQTTTQVAPEDTWVEITDTTHLPYIQWMSGVYTGWNNCTGLLLKDTSEYLNLINLVDTTNPSSIEIYHKFPPKLPDSPNFALYSMVGLRYTCTIDDTIRASLFINDGKKQYWYWVRNISDPYADKIKVPAYHQNWLLVPRLKQGYTVIFDTTTSGMGR